MTTPPTVEYREIPLTQGQVALVDAVDYEWLMQWKWCAWWNSHTQSYYAVRNAIMPNGKRGHIRMHRQILGLEYGDPIQGDHINTAKTLDNRRSNLRRADRGQQQHNQRKQKNNTSGFKGVHFHSQTGKWVAQIMVKRRYYYLGLYATPELAYAAYCKAAIRLCGEYARLK